MLMIAAALGLTGCTVPVKGLTGITVDDRGNLEAVFAWCGDNPPDGATLYIPGGFNGDGTDVANYQAPRLTGHFASVRLAAPTPGWTVDRPAPVLHPGITYDIYGWTYNSTASTSHVEFQLADRGRLASGTILVVVWDEAKNSPKDLLVSTGNFQENAHNLC
jgi:hypothetical protein